jgi:hypothetical protein
MGKALIFCFIDSANLVVVLLPPVLQHRLSLEELTQLQRQQDTVPLMLPHLRLALVLQQLSQSSLE